MYATKLIKMENLPDEINYQICEYLSLDQLGKLSIVCKSFYEIFKYVIMLRKIEYINQVSNELIETVNVKDIYKDVVFPIMRSQIYPIIEGLLNNPSSNIYPLIYELSTHSDNFANASGKKYKIISKFKIGKGYTYFSL